MKWIAIAASIVVALAIGCTRLSKARVTYVEVWLENDSDVKVTSVMTGEGRECSDFGILGSRGAGATAVVPVQFVKEYPVRWDEKFEGRQRTAVVDLRPFEGVKNRALTLRYKGNGQWAAELGREIRPTKRGEVPR